MGIKVRNSGDLGACHESQVGDSDSSKGLATRQRIIETAASLMNRRGWLATPVSDVLAATKLRKGGLCHHFEGIDSVARHAFQFAADKLVALTRVTALLRRVDAHKLCAYNDSPQ